MNPKIIKWQGIRSTKNEERRTTHGPRGTKDRKGDLKMFINFGVE